MSFEYTVRARQLDFATPGEDEARLLEERDRSLEVYLAGVGCPFEYLLRWGAGQISFDRVRLLEEHDRQLEQFLTETLSCPFEYPFRWEQLEHLEDPEAVGRLFEERDRALEQYLKVCSCGTCPMERVTSGAQALSAVAGTTPTITGSTATHTEVVPNEYTIAIPAAAVVGDVLVVSVAVDKGAAVPVPSFDRIEYSSTASALTVRWADSGTVAMLAGEVVRALYVNAVAHTDDSETDLRIFLAGDPGTDVQILLTVIHDGEYTTRIAVENGNTNADTQTTTAVTGGATGGLWVQFAAQRGSAVPPITHDTGTGVINDEFTAATKTSVLTNGTGTATPDVVWSGDADFQISVVTVHFVAASNFTSIDTGSTGTAFLATNSAITVVASNNTGTVSAGFTTTSVADGTILVWQSAGGAVAWLRYVQSSGLAPSVQSVGAGSDTTPGSPPWGVSGPTLPVSIDGSWIPISAIGRTRAAGGMDSDTPLHPAPPWTRQAGAASAKYDVYIATANNFPDDALWSGVTTPDRWDAVYKYFGCFSSGE